MKKQITVSTQILDGNLGDGWNDNNDAAHALADFTREIWTADLAEFVEQGYEIKFDIDVERNTSGCSRSASVDVENDELDHDDLYDLTRKIENSLTEENYIWDIFCNSDVAEGLAAE